MPRNRIKVYCEQSTCLRTSNDTKMSLTSDVPRLPHIAKVFLLYTFQRHGRHHARFPDGSPTVCAGVIICCSSSHRFRGRCCTSLLALKTLCQFCQANFSSITLIHHAPIANTSSTYNPNRSWMLTLYAFLPLPAFTYFL